MNNDPVNLIDPKGEFGFLAFVGILGLYLGTGDYIGNSEFEPPVIVPAPDFGNECI